MNIKLLAFLLFFISPIFLKSSDFSKDTKLMIYAYFYVNAHHCSVVECNNMIDSLNRSKVDCEKRLAELTKLSSLKNKSKIEKYVSIQYQGRYQ